MANISGFKPPEPKFKRPDLLLHPNLPKPLHGVNPRSILGGEWWDKERKKAYATNDHHCWACGVHRYDADYHQWLEAHEAYDINWNTGVVKLLEIVALCHSCHNYIHSGRLAMLLGQGQITIEKYNHIIERGNDIVRDLPPKAEPEGIMAHWKEWHLEIDGKCYYSKFESHNQWMSHFNVDYNTQRTLLDKMNKDKHN